MTTRDRIEALLPEPVRPMARNAYISTRRLMRRGAARLSPNRDTVECPCCGWHGPAFLPIGDRSDALCPKCESLERHRFLWVYLGDSTDLLIKPARILHFAPEPAIRAKLKQVSGDDYIDTDLFAENVTIKMDITNIVFGDGQFDCVICSHVLEHIVDDQRALRKIARVLAPSGFELLQVPIADLPDGVTYEDARFVTPEDRLHAYGQSDHVRIYGSDFHDRLHQAGFAVTVSSPDDLLPAVVARFGLTNHGDKAGEHFFRCPVA